MDNFNSKTILIVDDEPFVRRVVCKILSKNYVVLEAEDGEEAVYMARSRKPDLILMDLMMPKVDSFTACSVIKAEENTKAIPVVMLTAIGFELNKKLGQRLGANGYITKPFNAQELEETVTKFLSSCETGSGSSDN